MRREIELIVPCSNKDARVIVPLSMQDASSTPHSYSKRGRKRERDREKDREGIVAVRIWNYCRLFSLLYGSLG
jgi:hypothetical protein